MNKEKEIKNLIMTLNNLVQNKDNLNNYMKESKYHKNIQKVHKSKSRSRSHHCVTDKFTSKKILINKLLKIIEKLDTIVLKFNTKDR